MATEQQSGQTLVMFAAIAALLLGGLMALVGDYGILQLHYGAADQAALLGSQAGAAQIDVGEFARSGRLTVIPDAAISACRSVAHANAAFVPYGADSNSPSSSEGGIVCNVAPNYVEAVIDYSGPFVVRTLGAAYHFRASHRSYLSYGLAAPCDPGSC